MKKILLLSFLLAVQSLAAQFDDVKLEPGDTFAFVNAYITNFDNSPYVGELLLQGEKPYHKVKTKTDKAGFARVKVPMSDTYTLYCGREEPAFRKAKVGDFPYVTHEVRTYTQRFIRFKFQYKNEFGKPIPNERVEVLSSKTNKIFVDTTNKNGMAIYDLPFEDRFVVSVKYFDSLRVINVQDVGKEYKVVTTEFTWMGSKEKEYRAFLADSIARAYYVEIVAKIDSMLKTASLEEVLKQDIAIPIGYDSTAWVVDVLKKKAELYKKQLALDEKFFEKKKKTVLSVLYRLKNQYKNKIVVTDITGSMSPYMEEVLLWHALNFSEGTPTKYVFFNDGDATPDAKKEIGKTGGLYFCQGQIKDFATVVETMRKGMNAGGGGDSPENDVEALLLAAKKRTTEELILIADNFSGMRDISLLAQLKVPVRVIVCGTEEGPIRSRCSGAFWGEVNEEYLTLAYKTRGSIHTIREDIYDLYKLAEGKTINIDGVEFVLENGRFRQQKKL